MSESPAVEIRRSARRRRTVSAFREGDRIVVAIPDRFSEADEQVWADRMVERLLRQERRRRLPDDQLDRRARQLSEKYLSGLAVPASVRWVDNQNTRWGSCTPSDRTIRISTRLQEVPGWVLDYVILHELAHLLEHGHGPRFWDLVAGYPRVERARGFLEGFASAQARSAHGQAGSENGQPAGKVGDDALGECAQGEPADVEALG